MIPMSTRKPAGSQFSLAALLPACLAATIAAGLWVSSCGKPAAPAGNPPAEKSASTTPAAAPMSANGPATSATGAPKSAGEAPQNLVAKAPAPAPAATTPPAAAATDGRTSQPVSQPITTLKADPAQVPDANKQAPAAANLPPLPGQDPHAPTNAPVNNGPPGKLDCPVVDHDFGSMIEGEVARHTFEMKSAGENPLIIHSAKPTCGCTVGKVLVDGGDGQFVAYNYGDPIASGKLIHLEAELNTKNKHNLAQSKINIFCNDPRSTITLGLQATVDTYFSIVPPTLDFGEMSTSDAREKTATITGKRPGGFKLRQEYPQQIPGLKVELTPQSPDAEGKAERWDVKVALGPDAREGNMGYPVQLRSDQVVPGAPAQPDGQQPAYGASVMITARVRGLISFEPQYLSFGLVRPGQEVTRTLKVSSFDPAFTLAQPKSMTLAGPSPTVPDFKWSEHFTTAARPAADGKTMEVDLTLKGLPDSADGSFQGRLMIDTGHPSRPAIAVLFSGVCRPGVKAPDATAQPPTPPQKNN
jgi:uncharacterized protein DUF1573